MEFAIDTSTSFSEAERQFFKGPRGKFLNSFSLRIKMLLAEKVYCSLNQTVRFSITNLCLQVKVSSTSKVVCYEVEKGTREILSPIP